MVRATRAIGGILLLLLIGGCRWENLVSDDLSLEALQNAEFSYLRITTPGESEILLSSVRVGEDSIYGLLPSNSVNRPEVVIPFDSVAIIERRVSFDPTLWLLVGGFILAGMAEARW